MDKLFGVQKAFSINRFRGMGGLHCPVLIWMMAIAASAIACLKPAGASEWPRTDPAGWRKFQLERSEPRRFAGPFVTDAMAFYLVHHGGPLKVSVSVEADSPFTSGGYGRLFPNLFLLRFFDAEENLAAFHYHRFEEGKPGAVTFHHDFSAVPEGIYQVRYAGAMNSNMRVDLQATPEVSFGVLPMRTVLRAAEQDQFAGAYIYVPPGGDSAIPVPGLRSRIGKGVFWLYLSGAGNTASLFDGDGNRLAELTPGRTAQLDVKKTGVLWRLELGVGDRGHHFFGAGGSFDPILCPDPATARNIRGAINVASDGRIFPHRFQVRMWEWMQNLDAGDLSVSEADMREREEIWLAEPKNRWLLGAWGAFSHLRHIFATQTAENPYDGYGMSGALAVALALEEPLNPFFGNEAVARRLILAEFGRWIRLRETDAFMDTWAGHSGADAFTGTLFAYGYAGQHMKKIDRGLYGLWTEGARRMPDRFPHTRMSPENQSTHWLLNIYNMYRGSGIEAYNEVAREFAEALGRPELNLPMRAGYLMESHGPDATYQGLAANQFGRYYKKSGHAVAGEALERIYNLFNHTVARELDGTVHGASNFSHRTAGSWVERQYGGGTMQMAGELASAGVWHRNWDPYGDETLADAREQIRSDLVSYWYGGVRKPPRGFSDYRFISRYIFYPDKVVEGLLPVEESQRFTRNFGGQFIAVRRPLYYALVYLGKKDPDVRRIRALEVPGSVQRRTGGGLSMFWTPEYGNCILSMNWNAYTNQMVRVDTQDDRVLWPDYWTLEHEFDGRDKLVARSRLMELPVSIEREMEFRDDSLVAVVKLGIEGNVKFRRVVEQIPFLRTEKVREILFLTSGGWSAEGGLSRAVYIGSGEGKGVMFLFKERVNAGLGPETDGRGGTGGRGTRGLIEIELIEIPIDIAGIFSAGIEIELGYSIVPVSRGEIEKITW